MADMPNKVFQDSLLRSIRFEHWLRFYFAEPRNQASTEANCQDKINPDNGQENLEAVYSVPEVWKANIRLTHTEMGPLLDALQGRTLSLPAARDCVLEHVAWQCGLQPNAGFFGQVETLVNMDWFKHQLDLFHGWVQELIEAENSGSISSQADQVRSFADWENAFSAWAEAAVP